MFLSFQWVIKMKSFTLMFNILHSMSLKSGIDLQVHLNSIQPHLMCSRATEWLLH